MNLKRMRINIKIDLRRKKKREEEERNTRVFSRLLGIREFYIDTFRVFSSNKQIFQRSDPTKCCKAKKYVSPCLVLR